jgi:hypothetical protein
MNYELESMGYELKIGSHESISQAMSDTALPSLNP